MKKPFLFLVLFCAQSLFAQTAVLRTSDTVVKLSAGREAPLLESIATAGGQFWKNRAGESLPAFVETGGREIPLTWHWNRSASEFKRDRVVLVYESSSPHLQLFWEWRARAAFGPVEHRISVKNLEMREFWLPLQDSLSFSFAGHMVEKLEHVFVEKGADTPSGVGTHRVAVTADYQWTGFSSPYAAPREGEGREIIPWMLVRNSVGSLFGFYAGIEFTGRVRISLSHEMDSLHGVLGLNPGAGGFRTRLPAQSSLVFPEVFLGAFDGDTDDAGNLLRRWEREVLVAPGLRANASYPLLVNNSWGSGMAVDESLALRMIRDSAELGFDMFHMDAGWFRSVGDWRPDPKKFPNGLAPVSQEAHRLGLKFGLWVDWAQAGLSSASGALNARDPAIRDWLIADLSEDWKPEEFKGQTIDIGYAPAREWVEKETDRIVREYGVDMLEHDGYIVAKGCSRADHPHAPAGAFSGPLQNMGPWLFAENENSTDVSFHASNAYYEIQNKLRAKHPGLMLEVCNDGGRMVDFGAAAHADYFSITDTYDPLSNRRAFYDTSHVLPAAMLETYVEKWPSPHIANFRYMLRSGMMGWLSVMQDTTAWTSEQHDVARSEFQFYKETIRPLIREADLYHIGPRPDGIHWDALEYFDSGRQQGAIFVFRGSSPDEASRNFLLRGLDPGRKYKLHFRDSTSVDATMTGRELLTQGLSLQLAEPNSSEIVLLEEAKP